MAREARGKATAIDYLNHIPANVLPHFCDYNNRFLFQSLPIWIRHIWGSSFPPLCCVVGEIPTRLTNHHVLKTEELLPTLRNDCRRQKVLKEYNTRIRDEAYYELSPKQYHLGEFSCATPHKRSSQLHVLLLYNPTARAGIRQKPLTWYPPDSTACSLGEVRV